MFKRLEAMPGQPARPVVHIDFTGVTVPCRAGDSVAVALLASGHEVCRTTVVGGVPRGPYCMMGVCYDCLVTIDGQANRQACMTPVRDGMRVERQQRAREISS
ncbi:(2Fe-2S)-binding protein [Verticiella sediminum]|uniref:(2Fe-2S)-binding protein n=1 Tax=Verticiella sediminum TaxID=1247510 RepID=A0A556AE93_9BURK|nr:(2Fe-2S)-binding protein [Verticiella sediminum]TSH91211.1 (2Fe-2S)-binding protein [Verticiella sediminum]